MQSGSTGPENGDTVRPLNRQEGPASFSRRLFLSLPVGRRVALVLRLNNGSKEVFADVRLSVPLHPPQPGIHDWP